MSAIAVISALIMDETGDVKCGNCGKRLFVLKFKSKNPAKDIDRRKNYATIEMKCSRCDGINRLIIKPFEQ